MVPDLEYFFAIHESETLRIEMERDIKRYRAKLPILGEKRSWGTSGSDKLDFYKERVSNNYYVGKPYLELKDLNYLMDDQNQDYNRNAWSYLHKRYRKVEQRLNNPSPRYLVMGIKSGFPSAEEEKNMRLLEIINQIQEVIYASY
jgi:hypothetical protein